MLRDDDGTILDLAERARPARQPQRAERRRRRRLRARRSGWRARQVAAGLASFPGLPHRQETVGEIGGVAFVNDSKATNADSAARALASYDRVVWIAGGIAKEGGIEGLAPLFPRVARAFLIGRDAPLLAATLAAHGVPHEIAGTLEAAVPAAAAAARARRRAGGAALARLRLLGPVHRLRPARRPLPRAGRDSSARGGPPRHDLRIARGHLRPRPLVVDGGPLDPGGAAGADRLRLRDDAGGEPGRRRARHRLRRAQPAARQAGGLPRPRGRADGGGVPALAARACAGWPRSAASARSCSPPRPW